MKHLAPFLERLKPSKKVTAGWLLAILLAGGLMPLSLTFVPLTASAQCPGGVCPPPGGGGDGGIDVGGGCSGGGCGGGGLGEGLADGLGGMLGGLLQNPFMLILIMMMLQQLFGGLGGGATPQRGPAEEQPSLYPPSVGPQRTGPRGGGIIAPPAGAAPTPIPTPIPTPLATPLCTYRVTESGITPSSCTIRAGEFLRIVNESGRNRTLYSDPHDPSRATPGGITDACGALTPNQACRVYFLRAGTFGFHNHDTPTQRATVTVQ